MRILQRTIETNVQPIPKTIFENNQTLFFCFRKPKDSLKKEIFLKLASKRCFITSELEWTFDEHVWASPKLHFKTIKSSLQQVKNQISFSNRCTFKSTAVLYLRINSLSDEYSARTQVSFSKMGERSSSILKQKSNQKLSIPRNSRSNFSYSTYNLTWLFQCVQKPQLKKNQH